MYCCVGVLLALLAVYDLRALAAGNIGCLFSDTLCDQDREWCFDDHAFGHCLSDYGHYKEEDLHRYDLGSDELRQLEQEMQRLFLLGYRWSHTYTQCVLQTLLHSIRRKSEFDISNCNGDLDQDLEGALRAIEGEELEQVDPRDLAIVRFTPSATDPHSAYADEVYFPPIKDQLHDDQHDLSDDHHDDPQEPVSSGPGENGGRTGGTRTGGTRTGARTGGGRTGGGKTGGGKTDGGKSGGSKSGGGGGKSGSGGKSGGGKTGGSKTGGGKTGGGRTGGSRTGGGAGVDKEHSHPPKLVDSSDGVSAPGHPYPSSASSLRLLPPLDLPLQPPDPDALNYINYYGNDNGFNDEDVYQSPYHYQTPLNPVYRKRGMPFGNAYPRSHSAEGEMPPNGNVYPRPFFPEREMPSGNSYPRPFSSAEIKELSDILEDMRMKENTYKADDSVIFPGGYLNDEDEEEEEEDEGVFAEEPSSPMYTEAGLQFIPGEPSRSIYSQRGLQSMSEEPSRSIYSQRGLQSMSEEPSRSIYSQRGLQSMSEEPSRSIYSQRGLQSMLEEPSRPIYMPRGHQAIPELDEEKFLMESSPRDGAIWANLPENVPVAPGRYHNIPEELRNMPSVFDNLQDLAADPRDFSEDLPTLPESLRNFPGLMSQYEPQELYIPENIETETAFDRYAMQDDMPYQASVRDVPRDALLIEDDIPDMSRTSPRLTALEAAFGPQLNDLRDYDDPPHDYPDYDIDEYDADYGDLLPEAEYNFQRDERLDVKKPGPFFKSANNYGFDYTDDDDDNGERRDDQVDEVGGGDVILTRLLQESPPPTSDINADVSPDDVEEDVVAVVPEDSLALPQQVPDLLLADEGLVDDATATDTPDSQPLKEQQQEGQAEAQQQQQQEEEQQQQEDSTSTPTPPTGTPPTTTQAPEPSSYVYITIKGRFLEWEQASNLARMVVRLSGLQPEDMDKLSVDKDEVTFHIKVNSEGITAADVAKKTEDMREIINKDLGLEISQTGVGTKTTMSAVVFSSGEQHILAAAAVVCGVMAALLVAATVLYFLRRHAKSKAKLQGLTAHDTEASKDYQELCRARMAGKAGEGGKTEATSTTAAAATHAPSHRVSSLSKDSDNGNNSPSSRSSTSSWSEEPVASNMDISTGHMVLSYMEDHLKNKDRLEQEWIALCAYEAEPCATTLALKPENNQKNRYPDAVPYDHNRVVLNAHSNLNGSDYINASSITDHDPRNPAYIATQGPLASTASDFWQLVWEQGSVVLVMLTRLTENGHAFCHRYWPEEGSDLYHIYEVHLVSEHIWCDDYLVRSFYLKNVRTGETRTVTQFHFLSWPDSGTPASTKALLEFRRKVNKSYRGRSCPIIVHCSDGIGRTGTYCLIDMVLNRMAKGAKEIDIAATLEHIRDQRPHMVKSKAQFEFVLMAVAEEVHAILKALPQ